MPQRRQHGGSRRGRSASVAANTPDPAHGMQLCLSCSCDVGDDAIGCDECESWVHGTVMCSGLSKELIEAIHKYDGANLKYVCTKCRVTHSSARGNSPSSSTEAHMAELVCQLFQQMKGICFVIKELSDQVKSLASQPTKTPAPIPAQTDQVLSADQHPSLQSAIRSEVKEMQEREKRRQFIIVRGCNATSHNDLETKLGQIVRDLTGKAVQMTNICNISGHSDIFRVKIPSDSDRKLLLDNAKSLKGSPNDGVFINRDLTYAQRTELYNRRQTRRTQDPQGPRSAAAVLPAPAGDTAAASVDRVLASVPVQTTRGVAPGTLGN